MQQHLTREEIEAIQTVKLNAKEKKRLNDKAQEPESDEKKAAAEFGMKKRKWNEQNQRNAAEGERAEKKRARQEEKKKKKEDRDLKKGRKFTDEERDLLKNL